MTSINNVFDVTSPYTCSNNDTESYNQDSPIKLNFTDAYDDVNIRTDSHEDGPVISNVERSPRALSRRSRRVRKPVDRVDPSPSITPVEKARKSRKFNKNLRRSRSPPEKTPMKRLSAPTFTKVYNVKYEMSML